MAKAVRRKERGRHVTKRGMLAFKRSLSAVFISIVGALLYSALSWGSNGSEIIMKPPRAGKKILLRANHDRRATAYATAEILRRLKDLPDPFKPYFLQTAKELEKRLRAMKRLKELSTPKTELQKFSLSQLKLTSVLKTEDGIWAMVKDPRGRGHVVKEGTFIGNKGAQVDKIIMKRHMKEGMLRLVRKIIIKEPYVDKHGNIKYKYLEKEIPDVF